MSGTRLASHAGDTVCESTEVTCYARGVWARPEGQRALLSHAKAQAERDEGKARAWLIAEPEVTWECPGLALEQRLRTAGGSGRTVRERAQGAVVARIALQRRPAIT